LFPTGVLSGIEVDKSYTPDRPGAFGGGLINLNTRGVPESGFGDVSISVGGNSESTGRQGLAYEGGSRDFLGTDDGTRALPEEVQNASQGERSSTRVGKSFSNNYRIQDTTLGPDLGLSTASGERFNALGGKIGVLGTVSYGRKSRNSDQIRRSFAKNGDQLIVQNDFVRERTDQNVGLGGMLVAGGKWEGFELTSNTFVIRKTTDRAQITSGFDASSDKGRVRDYVLSWSERELIAQQFVGQHDLDWLELEWRVMRAEASKESPDRRTYRYEVTDGGDLRFDSDSTMQRRYNTVEDTVDSLGIDATLPLSGSEGFQFDAKTGITTYEQQRSSETERFEFDPTDDADLDPDNPEVIFDPDNIGDTVTYREQTRTNDDYEGAATVDAAYLMGEARWPQALRVVAGARRESARFDVRTFQANSGREERVEGGFEESRTLPAINSTWSITDGVQVRAAAGQSVSRPTLNELSPATYFDTDTGERFVGNPDLVPAKITGADLRWSWYPDDGEKLFAGVFRKEIDDPFEQIFITRGGNDILNQVVNAESATVTGTEFGARFGVDRLVGWLGAEADWWSDLYVAGNATLIESSVELSGQGTATAAERSLQGQADQVYNLETGYSGAAHDVTLAYNYVGERIHRAGLQGKPDVIRQPVPTLDATWSWQAREALELKAELGNMLDPEIEYTQGGRLFRSSNEGVSASLSLKWSFY
jgi:outer membrane receptor protein involved in Fe transport